MFDVHGGDEIENCTVIKTGRIMLELLEDDHFMAFHLGFCDRISEEYDQVSYNKISSLNTIRELFYHLGYKISDREIYFSEQVQKNPPLLRDFIENMKNYLNRFDLLTFYERSNLAIQQTLP